MDSQLHRKPIKLNPELEALRTKGLQESLQTHDWVLQMIKRTTHLHAGFLFEDLKTLQDICLFVGESPNKITDAGWEAFGYHLGLSSSALKVINYNNFNKEDPCYNILLAYVQYENATIGKILEALLVIKRFDVLSRIQDSINDLADKILNYQNNINISNNSREETSDYESLPISEDCQNTTSNNISSSNKQILKPKFIPPAPFIFQNLSSSQEYSSQQIQEALVNVLSKNLIPNYEKDNISNTDKLIKKIACIENLNDGFDTRLVRESIQNSNNTESTKDALSHSKKQKYGLKILLTFAEDGEEYAKEICKIFRKKRENFPSIGVLVLSEQISIVNKDPLQFIYAAFCQVDYVCPIITPKYCDIIAKKEKATSVSNIHVDAHFAFYIYRLMNSYFISNDCLNDKFRCIIPESVFPLVPFNFLLTNPVFGIWVKSNEVEELAVRLLKSKMKSVI